MKETLEEFAKQHLPNGGSIVEIKDNEFNFEIIVDKSNFDNLIKFMSKMSKMKIKRIDH